MYERDFGFNFASFTPAELFSRIQGALTPAARPGLYVSDP